MAVAIPCQIHLFYMIATYHGAIDLSAVCGVALPDQTLKIFVAYASNMSFMFTYVNCVVKQESKKKYIFFIKSMNYNFTSLPTCNVFL